MRFIHFLTLLLIIYNLTSCNSPTDKDFDQSDLLSDLSGKVIVPIVTDFKSESTALDKAVQQFVETPSEQNLEVVQDQWKTTILAWKKCQLFNVGDVAQTYLANRIQKWPVNKAFIEQNIADTVTIDSDFIDGIGSTAKGLSTIEYFVFNIDSSNAEIVAHLQSDVRRLDYLSAVATNLTEKAAAFEQAWSEYLETYKSATGNGFEASISLQVNEMVAVLERINKYKISKPAGLSGTVVNGDQVEAKNSEYSKELIISSLEGFKFAFVSSDKQYTGFDDYLDFTGAEFANEPLADKILTQIDLSIKAIEEINGPLHLAVRDDLQSVADAREAILQLLVLVKVDLASSLSITITFSDSDGD